MKKPTQVIILLYALAALSNGGPRGFHLFKASKTWSEAQRFCRENYIDLATIETEEEWSNIQLILQNLNLYPWIGLYDDYNSWRWSLNGKYLYQDSNTPFGTWWSFNPSYSPKEYCVEITSGILNDARCDALKYPVCYNEPTNSYIVISISMNWLAAQSYCRLHYTDLTSVRNKLEKDTIFGKIQLYQLYWTGLSRESWKWSDKSKLLLINSAPGEGLNTYGSGYCAKTGLYGFIASKCGESNSFICTVPVMKTYKVKIKTDSLNLDNATAQDSLLQNLEKQFKEHGIHQNFTLVWRKQANGKLFNTEE